MLVVREIKYSQVCNFWQSVCEILVRYFFSISLISVPPFPFLSPGITPKIEKNKTNKRISRYALINTKSWH